MWSTRFVTRVPTTLLAVVLGLLILVLGDAATPYLWVGGVHVVVDGVGMALSTFLMRAGD